MGTKKKQEKEVLFTTSKEGIKLQESITARIESVGKKLEKLPTSAKDLGFMKTASASCAESGRELRQAFFGTMAFAGKNRVKNAA